MKTMGKTLGVLRQQCVKRRRKHPCRNNSTNSGKDLVLMDPDQRRETYTNDG